MAALPSGRKTREHAMTRLLTLLTISLLLVGLAATGALAQQYPPSPGPVTEVDVTVTTPGATVRIEGRGWGPDTTVEIEHGDSGEAQGAPAITAEVGADGSFVADVLVPDDAAAGDFEVTARGVDPDGTAQVRPLVLSVADDDDDGGAAGAATSRSGGEPAVATTSPASASLVGGNSLLALLVLGATVALVMVRRRSTVG